MSRQPQQLRDTRRALGTYVSVYLSQPLYDFIAGQCDELGASMPVWIRERVLEACPPEIQAEVHAIAKKGPAAMADAQDEETRALIEKHRERVLDLEARGFLPTAICSVTRLPLKIVNQILATKAPPKRSRK